ncbi:MAG: Cys-tRNA(Pro) deacylase [Clostridia bacterium]|nr:Cys-tRNA(Pro) deacylase [Clostridia bacterium]
MKKTEKTNVMRLLDQKNIPYIMHDYTASGAVAGEDVAGVLGENPDEVFKTLVTVGKSKQYYVFLVPVCKELNLKKAAKAVNEKSIEMIKAKELLPLTGYVHGGCSPIGMKKAFPTIIDESAKSFEKIFFSAGKIGYQVEVNVSDIEKIIRVGFSDISD